MSLGSANASIKQAAANTQNDAQDIRDPVVYVGAPVEAGLDEFNGAAEGTRTYEDGDQANAVRARQREGECGEGSKVYQLVAALGCRRRLVQGSKHRVGQGERHDECQGYVEILTHPPGCIGRAAQR